MIVVPSHKALALRWDQHAPEVRLDASAPIIGGTSVGSNLAMAPTGGSDVPVDEWDGMGDVRNGGRCVRKILALRCGEHESESRPDPR